MQREGAPIRAGVDDDFAHSGLSLAKGNVDRAARFVRIGELLRPDPEHRFPDWHPVLAHRGLPVCSYSRVAAP